MSPKWSPMAPACERLCSQERIEPAAIHSSEVLEEHGDAYLYLGAIRFIKTVKRGHFAEHSPMLNDISYLESWQVRSL